MRTLLGALLLAVAVLPHLATAAAAHPLGNFTVNRYSRLDVAADGVRLRYVLDLAEIPTLQELFAAGLDAAAPEETIRARLLREKAAALASGARLAIAGRPVAWVVRDAALELPEGQGGLRTLRLTLTLGAVVRPPDGAALDYRDTNYEGRIGWREVVLRGAVADSSVPATDRTNELREYPADAAAPPLEVSAASATIRLGASVGGGVAVGGAARLAMDGAAEQLTAFLRGGPTDLLALLAALAVSAALGAVHALGPGHGKAIVGAYLVGSRGTPRHALLLGATVTATHTAGVYALGLVTLVAAQYVLPERLYPILGLVSGLLVVGIGAGLARSRLGALRRDRHNHPEHGHAHGPGRHTHDAPGLRGLLGLGVSGGLLPCPTALVVLLAAVSFHNVALGMALVAAFSLGLAAVLTGIGLTLVWGGRALGRSRLARGLAGSPLARALPVLSAGAVAVAGLLIALDAARALG